MKISFKNKSISFWLGLGTAALGLVSLVLFIVYGAMTKTFPITTFAALIIAVICGLLIVFFDYSFLSVIMAAMYGLGFGLYLQIKVPLYALWFTNTWSMADGNESIGVITAILVLMFIGMIMAVVLSFMGKAKKGDKTLLVSSTEQ